MAQTDPSDRFDSEEIEALEMAEYEADRIWDLEHGRPVRSRRPIDDPLYFEFCAAPRIRRMLGRASARELKKLKACEAAYPKVETVEAGR